MNGLLKIPLIRTLIALNLGVVVALLIPKLWPLPHVEGAENDDVSASEIAEYLGDSIVDLKSAQARPIFHLNRRPPKKNVKVSAPKPVARKAIFELQLVGIMGVNTVTQTAYILHTGKQETTAVSVGQIIDGWNILEIKVGSVVVSNGTEQKTLNLS